MSGGDWLVILGTVAGIFGYVFIFMLLVNITGLLFRAIRNGNVLVKLILIIPAIILAAICFVLNVIHTIGFFWMGYRLFTGLRNIWHQGK